MFSFGIYVLMCKLPCERPCKWQKRFKKKEKFSKLIFSNDKNIHDNLYNGLLTMQWLFFLRQQTSKNYSKPKAFKARCWFRLCAVNGPPILSGGEAQRIKLASFLLASNQRQGIICI
jgi:hypothetical protein